jgi:hypothetical protein
MLFFSTTRKKEKGIVKEALLRSGYGFGSGKLTLFK